MNEIIYLNEINKFIKVLTALLLKVHFKQLVVFDARGQL